MSLVAVSRRFSGGKRLSILAIFLSTVCGPVSATREPFSLLISSIPGSVRIGSDIRVVIKLTNEMNRPITLTDRSQVCDFGVEVRGSSGRSVPETTLKSLRNCNDLVAGKLIMLTLAPAESHEYVIFVNQLYDMSRPDRYEMEVAREIPQELGKGKVKSNKITVTITE